MGIKGPVCARCQVVKGLEVLLDNYVDFLAFLEKRELGKLTEHAQGFSRGQHALMEEVLDDVGQLAAYLDLESKIREKGNKGL